MKYKGYTIKEIEWLDKNGNLYDISYQVFKNNYFITNYFSKTLKQVKEDIDNY